MHAQTPSIDPTFNSGLFFEDRFAGSSLHSFLPRKMAGLANGDVIVAGLVAWGAQVGHTGKMNLGLVRP